MTNPSVTKSSNLSYLCCPLLTFSRRDLGTSQTYHELDVIDEQDFKMDFFE